jgi:hypothetical protein
MHNQKAVWGTSTGCVNSLHLAETCKCFATALPRCLQRLTPKDGDHLYGTFEVRAQTTCEPGAVTAFYTRSSDLYPNELAGDFSEIDWEWINANPAKEECSLWLNAQQG